MSGFRYAPSVGGSQKKTSDGPQNAAAAAAIRRAAQTRLPDLPPTASTSRPVPSRPASNEAGSGLKHRDVLVLSDGDEDDAFEEQEPEDEDDELQVDIAPPRQAHNGSHQGAQATKNEEEQLKKLESEIASVDAQLNDLKQVRETLRRDHDLLRRKIREAALLGTTTGNSEGTAKSRQAGSSSHSAQVIDFTRSDFDWSKRVIKTAKDVFGIESFRLCQEAAINASLSGREVMCVMPTGGGKSLIYQLPAILAARGTTVVITPLISLMDDQCFNLRSRGVAAEMLNSSTTSEEQRSITRRLLGNSQASTVKKGKGKAKVEDDEVPEDEMIKLFYVTPERIDKSKTFVNTLQKMYDAGLLVRFVIDEAHCVSTLGHDYRRSYLALKRLKALFPDTPILATTATAPQVVVADVLKTLALPQRMSPGNAALPHTTILFTSPLFRPNLRYQVRPKPQGAMAQVQAIVDFILDSHKEDIGIVYCLSRADTENVTISMQELSKGKIRAAVYHAGLEDEQKLRVYDLWRRRKIQVVVATNASFGLGIDNPHVRFVIHHSPPKSMSNWSQESGRAGRDGETSDCLLFWRAADASRLSTLIVDEFYTGGREKLYEMVRVAEDLRMCRKLAFAQSFDGGAEASDRTAARFDEGPTANEPCGTCDNCLRDPSTITSLDVTVEAYRALRIICAATRMHGTLTLPQACDLVRGLGKGVFTTQSLRGGKSSKGKATINVQAEAGGKVALTKDETEQLLVKLMIDDYLSEQFHTSGWTTNSYLKPTSRAARFTRFAPDVAGRSGGEELPVKIMIDVRGKSSKKRGKIGGGKSDAAGGKKKRKKSNVETIEIDDDEDDDEGEEGEDADVAEDEERFDFEDEDGPDEDELDAVKSAAPQVTDDGWEVWPA